MVSKILDAFHYIFNSSALLGKSDNRVSDHFHCVFDYIHSFNGLVGCLATGIRDIQSLLRGLFHILGLGAGDLRGMTHLFNR